MTIIKVRHEIINCKLNANKVYRLIEIDKKTKKPIGNMFKGKDSWQHLPSRGNKEFWDYRYEIKRVRNKRGTHELLSE